MVVNLLPARRRIWYLPCLVAVVSVMAMFFFLHWRNLPSQQIMQVNARPLAAAPLECEAFRMTGFFQLGAEIIAVVTVPEDRVLLVKRGMRIGAEKALVRNITRDAVTLAVGNRQVVIHNIATRRV